MSKRNSAVNGDIMETGFNPPDGETARLTAIIDGLPCARERTRGTSCKDARAMGVKIEPCPMCAAKEAAHGG